MEVSSHINSIYNSMSYRIGDCLIDPGDEWEEFDGANCVFITHCHFDHVYGLNSLIKLNPKVKIFTNEYGRDMLIDARKNLSLYIESPFVISDPCLVIAIKDGGIVKLNSNINVRGVYTPGHNPSCITWIFEESVFTGDSYIPGKRTITNIPGGNKEDSMQSLEIIRRLSIGKKIYPGHKI